MLPFELFEKWYAEAEKGGENEPFTMVVSSVQGNGRPSSRVVYLKQTLENTYYFFTNYNSAKSKEFSVNPYATYNFHWRKPLHRQVRIEGEIVKASRDVSDAYFKTRPRGSQIGAWSSPQSQKIENRAELEKRVQEFEQQFVGRDVPRPEFWGGFGLKPNRFEFWQEGEFRLHTRRVFVLNAQREWTESLLAP